MTLLDVLALFAAVLASGFPLVLLAVVGWPEPKEIAEPTPRRAKGEPARQARYKTWLEEQYAKGARSRERDEDPIGYAIRSGVATREGN